MNTPEICPLCQRVLNYHTLQTAGKRICSLCRGIIGRKHKYRIGSNGLLQHRDCKNPTGSIETDKPKGMFDER
jgi:hypothetical protein